jgi:hypothetical protein
MHRHRCTPSYTRQSTACWRTHRLFRIPDRSSCQSARPAVRKAPWLSRHHLFPRLHQSGTTIPFSAASSMRRLGQEHAPPLLRRCFHGNHRLPLNCPRLPHSRVRKHCRLQRPRSNQRRQHSPQAPHHFRPHPSRKSARSWWNHLHRVHLKLPRPQPRSRSKHRNNLPAPPLPSASPSPWRLR